MHARLVATAIVCLSMTALIPLSSAAAPAPFWSLPTSLDPGNGVLALEMAGLPRGGALAVWESTAEGAFFLAASEYIAGSGWQPPTYLAVGGFCDGLSLSVNPNGYGVLSWIEYTGIAKAGASFYRPGRAMSPPTYLALSPGSANGVPSSTIDGNGVVTVIFAEDNGTADVELAVRGNAEFAEWEVPTLIEVNDTVTADGQPGAVLALADNSVLAIWQRVDATGLHLGSASYNDATGWSVPRVLDNNSNDEFREVHLEAFPDGRAAAVWLEINSTFNWGPARNWFSPAAGWSFPEREMPVQEIYGGGQVDFACGGAGTCVAAWPEQVNGSGVVSLSRSEDGGATFAPPVTLFTGWQGSVLDAVIDLSPAGDALVEWAQEPDGDPFPTTAHTVVATLTPAGATNLLWRVDRDDAQLAGHLAAAIGTDGQLVAGWLTPAAGKDAALAVVFPAADLTPPKLRVTAPLSGALLNENSVVVTGTTDPDATLVVNGLLAQVRPDGSFALRIPLVAGNNTVRVIALDASGNNETVLIPVTVFDSATELAGQLAAANLTIVWLGENITTLEEEQNTTIMNFLILQNNLASLNASWTQMRDDLSTARNESASALASGNAAMATVSETRSQAAAAQSAAGTATTFGLMGVLAGIAGVALAAMATRRGGQTGAPKKSFAQRGGVGQGGGLYNEIAIKEQGVRTMDISRQTPKTDFGDRMKAGLDTAGGIAPQEPGSLDLSAESESEEEEEGDEERSASKDHATGLATGKRSAAPRDAATGQASGKRTAEGEGEGEGIYNPKEYTRGPRQSTSVDGSFDQPPAAGDAKYGSVAGAHRDESIADGSARSSAAPRDAATGQATGKRQATGDLDGDAAREIQSPRDAASGQASGKRSSMAGEYARDVAAPRDAASGQASGKRAEAPMGVHHDVKAPRDAATGQASGRRAPDSSGGTSPEGMAINEQGVAEPPPKKKPTK